MLVLVLVVLIALGGLGDHDQVQQLGERGGVRAHGFDADHAGLMANAIAVFDKFRPIGWELGRVAPSALTLSRGLSARGPVA